MVFGADVFSRRITPADAGKTVFWSIAKSALRDHPRGCGENYGLCRPSSAAAGSPPRMRGKLLCCLSLTARKGITPADAGKTIRLYISKLGAEDHPRGCGENSPMPMLADSAAGSPPRMRGKPADCCMMQNTARITPADAGKTINVLTVAAVVKDHPRGCGENDDTGDLLDGVQGSPPRMRGKPNAKHSKAPHTRITPADAGKTNKCTIKAANTEDHPRGCGENRKKKHGIRHTAGSPPRMRGKPPPTPIDYRDLRITPADAGKTVRVCIRRVAIQDHPRGCGENERSASERAKHLGSPPRMRGKLLGYKD